MSLNLIVSIITFALAITCYRLGGSDVAPKIVRRLGVTLCVGVNVCLRMNWFGLISLPLLFGALCLGYGATSKLLTFYKKFFDDELAKFFTRLTCGIAYTVSSLFILWGNWWLLGWHVLCGTAFCVLNGTQMFKMKAEREETAMGAIITFAPIMCA